MAKNLPIEVDARNNPPLGMPVEQFLRAYWQRRPLLIRHALPGYRAPLSGDDLAGLACMRGALARIVTWQSARTHSREAARRRNDGDWQVLTGPFDDATFAQLPPDHWTLLVQDVDKWDMQVAALLDRFRFLPRWRVDDVMISYAEDGGGVGAHVDQYDVFLVQGSGQRHWRIDARANPPTAFRPNLELKLLERFTPSHEWVLNPGDMLYLPPGVPHDGVAVGACMTLSVGMRAPSVAELTLDLAEHLAEALPESLRYSDASLLPASNAGEIDAAALRRVRAALGPIATTLDEPGLADWFGTFITRYRSAGSADVPTRGMTPARLDRALAAGKTLARDPWTRMAWVRRGRAANLFVDGAHYACGIRLAQQLCSRAPVRFSRPPGAPVKALLLELVKRGQLRIIRS